MMRAWGNRPDTIVCDEPLYAYYLAATKKDHPGAAEVIEHGETDWRRVVDELTGPLPTGKSVYFQKHMTHHLLPAIGCDWLGRVTNCFLIRHPRDVLTSYIKIVPNPTLDDTGFPQQREIFEWVRTNRATIPPVIDAVDVLANPRRVLGLLCDALGVEFQDCMLAWTPGLRSTDGVWARHWYKEVETSTSFRPHTPKADAVPERLGKLHRACLECYETLYEHRLH